MLEEIVNSLYNAGKFVKRTIATCAFAALGFNALVAETETRKQQYVPRVFDNPVLIDGSMDPMFVSLALGANDELCIAYTTPTTPEGYAFDLKFAKFNNSNFDIETITSSTTSTNGVICSLAFNPLTNQPAIAKETNFHFFDGSEWITQQVFVPRGNRSHSLAFNPENNYPYIASNSFGDWNLYLSNYNGTEWVHRLLSWNDAVFESLKFDLNNQPCIAYEVADWVTHKPSLHYYGPLATSSIEEKVFYLSTSLAINKNGQPCISYGKNPDDGTSLLKYAQWDGSQWQIEIVDSDFAGASTSLLFDSNNNPIIFYINNSKEIKLTTKMNSQWHKQVIANYPGPYIHSSYSVVSSAITKTDKVICAYSVPNASSGNPPNIGVWLIPEKGALPQPTSVFRWQEYK